MNIKKVNVKPYCIDLATPVRAYAAGLMTNFGIVVVEIIDEDENKGYGYTAMMGGQEGSIASIIRDTYSEIITNFDSTRVEYLWNKMWKRTHYIGRGGSASFAIAAVDTALWDLNARRLKQPLWRLLGGNDPKVKAYSGNIDLNFPIEKILENATKNIEEDGFKAIKMRLGRETLKEDLQRVESVRNHIGDNIELMADANEAWRLDQAIKASNLLSEFNLTWLEEPITPDDFSGYNLLKLKGSTPIAAGENLHTLQEFQQLISNKGVDFPEPDFTTCGGITPFMKIAALAEANNLPVMSHGAHDVHIQILGGCSNAAYIEVHAFGIEDYISHPMEMEDGFGVASDRYGIGFDFDFDKLKKFEVD